MKQHLAQIPSRFCKKSELNRLKTLVKFEKAARLKGIKAIAGVDEAGRGPLAGPIVVAVCMIEDEVFFPGIDDSKKLTPIHREKLFAEIVASSHVVYGVAQVSNEIIDQINIHQATIQGMVAAVDAMSQKPELLLVDGLGLKHPHIPIEKIVGGDSKSQSIAAASVLAKVTRDRLMQEYHKKWPDFGFDEHKGYGTKKHLEAIAKHGLTPIHRRSYAPCQP